MTGFLPEKLGVIKMDVLPEKRRFNRRFLTLANHYLFEPVACTPESGWEKGQVENQVGNIREWLFTPTPKFADFTELNTWLAQRCRELALLHTLTNHRAAPPICLLKNSRC